MLKQLLKLTEKYREIILYGVFGGLTTVVDWAVYMAWTWAFPGKYANVAGTGLAWVAAVLFAYFTNRRWVFPSRADGLIPRLRECAAFFGSRILSGLVNLWIMYVAVDLMRFDGGTVKLASNVLVIIINYLLSKFLVFRKGRGG